MKNKIIVQDQEISIVKDDYISLTDIAKSKNSDEPKDVVKNWLRNKNTIEFLGLWEKINNSSFKGVEFDTFRSEAGLNSFTLSPINIDKNKINFIYSSEADLLNVALFGVTAKQWKKK
jgi:hypothetical protein